MALEDDLRLTLIGTPEVSAIVGSRVWWGVLGGGWDVTNPTLPAVVLHLIDDIPTVAHDTRGRGTGRARIQADCISATSITEARDLANAVVDALLGRHGCTDAVQRDAHDSTAKRYKRLVDLAVWHQ